MSYPGAKAGSGVYQLIINQMPPHAVYIEPFLGSGAVMRRKRPAADNLGFDLDERPIETACRLAGNGDWISQPGRTDAPGVAVPRWRFECRDGVDYMVQWQLSKRVLFYCDPPYLAALRRQHRRMYRYELTRAQHVEFIEACRRQSAMVMVSGYRSELYDRALSDWRLVEYTAQTHRGPARECLWMNFPEPVELHDYRYLGGDFRERERIRRKQARWYRRLLAMPALERLAMLAALDQAGVKAGNGR